VDDYFFAQRWSQDGRYLLFVDSGNKVQLVEAASWQARDITEQLIEDETSIVESLADWIEPIPVSFESMTSLPTPIAEPLFACPSAPTTRLHVGDTARISFTDGTSTLLRSKPEAGDNVIDKLPEGIEFEIIGGPICYSRPGRSDAYVYWEVQVPSRNNRTGWAAEGDFDAYYIEPWP
jgi:hypothetical protein